VQQELMNLILNREINGYKLYEGVKILAAMNPSGKYGANYDYQVVDMDSAQENRFVWLYMEPDHLQWIDWAIDAGIELKVIEFIQTFPEYLKKTHEDSLSATPRSYERISKVYKMYQEKKDSIPRSVFLNVIKGNVGDLIGEEFIHFVESDYTPLLSFEDIFTGESLSEAIIARIQSESHTRLYLTAKNILKSLVAAMKHVSVDTSYYVIRLIEFLRLYPVDLGIGIMKDIRSNYPEVYQYAIEQEAFVDFYFEAHNFNKN
jgi:hypothetical protein